MGKISSIFPELNIFIKLGMKLVVTLSLENSILT
jgi:hypothetical protein